MAVYVDPIMNHGGSSTFKWKHSCHMYSDTLDELHAMAKKIGLRREWFQNGRVPHYDLNVSRHAVALGKGVVQHTRREAVDFWVRQGWFSPRLRAMEFEGEPEEQKELFAE